MAEIPVLHNRASIFFTNHAFEILLSLQTLVQLPTIIKSFNLGPIPTYKNTNHNSILDLYTKYALNTRTVVGIHSSAELETKLKAATKLSRLAILYFTATWCGPCRIMGPVFKSLAEKHRDVVFLKADIDEAGEVAQRWNVSSVPTFFFLRNGKEVDKVVGADKSGLERKVAMHAAKKS